MRILVVVFSMIFAFTAYSQKECKVLVDELVGTYEGKCKKGLANGKGKAVGKDTYIGKFKAGYPHGKGTYTYANGDVFKGEFEKGRRHGQGNYEILVEEKKVLKEGFWEDDVYVGPKKKRPYKVRLKRNIDRFSFTRVGDGSSIKVFVKQNGIDNTSLTDVMNYGSSGSEQNIGRNIGYENIEFPFSGKLRYTTANKLKTATYEVVFEYEILRAGEWKLTIHN